VWKSHCTETGRAHDLSRKIDRDTRWEIRKEIS
jgi:hypothetical protein